MCNVYIQFQSDPHNPLVEVMFPVIEGSQHQDVIIPCKPTSKRWEVKLIKEGDEVNKCCLNNYTII